MICFSKFMFLRSVEGGWNKEKRDFMNATGSKSLPPGPKVFIILAKPPDLGFSVQGLVYGIQGLGCMV